MTKGKRVAMTLIVVCLAVIGGILQPRGARIEPIGLENIPLYPGAVKLGESTSLEETRQTIDAYFSFDGAGVDVYNWYKSEMPKQGWRLSFDHGYRENGVSLECRRGFTKVYIILNSSSLAHSFNENEILALHIFQALVEE
jgi:hypothetical protein